MMDKLTPKQARFIEEYLIDLNATQAAIRAGYAKGSADVEGCRLLGNAKVAVAVAEAQAERSERTLITQDIVLEGLLKEARNEGEGSTHSARVTAWTQLGRHLSMFVDRAELEHGVKDDMAQLLNEIDGLRRSK